jgi:hypothetical protein
MIHHSYENKNHYLKHFNNKMTTDILNFHLFKIKGGFKMILLFLHNKGYNFLFSFHIEIIVFYHAK